MTEIPKNKHIRLAGKALSALNAAIHERDGGCIICGAWVDPGEKFHHVRRGKDKEDRIECGVILCYRCHQAAHGKLLAENRRKCIAYLARLHPEYWRDK